MPKYWKMKVLLFWSSLCLLTMNFQIDIVGNVGWHASCVSYLPIYHCHAGVMIVVWRTPGNIETRGHLVIVGTLPDCLETYRQYKHIWNKQLASPPQLGTLPPQSEGGQLASSGNEVFVVFSLTRIWSTGRPSGTPCTTSRPVGRDTGSEHHQVRHLTVIWND